MAAATPTAAPAVVLLLMMFLRLLLLLKLFCVILYRCLGYGLSIGISFGCIIFYYIAFWLYCLLIVSPFNWITFQLYHLLSRITFRLLLSFICIAFLLYHLCSSIAFWLYCPSILILRVIVIVIVWVIVRVIVIKIVIEIVVVIVIIIVRVRVREGFKKKSAKKWTAAHLGGGVWPEDPPGSLLLM